MRALVAVVAVLGCKDEPLARPTAGACEDIDLTRVSTILGDPAHPCRARVDAATGRMLATELAFSATIVSTRPVRGGGLVITCQHCTGVALEGLRDPERETTSPIRARAGAQRLVVHRMYSPLPPPSAFDARAHLSRIEPRHDFVIGTLGGTVAVHDPHALLAAPEPWADPEPGTQILVLGFPSDFAGHRFAGELVASVGEILDDARARDLLARADADEAAIPYDPTVELVVAARAAHGMSGGGAFDAAHRYLGVAVRGTVRPVDGTYLTRIVRARFVLDQLAAALERAPAATRADLAPFVTLP